MIVFLFGVWGLGGTSGAVKVVLGARLGSGAEVVDERPEVSGVGTWSRPMSVPDGRKLKKTCVGMLLLRLRVKIGIRCPATTIFHILQSWDTSHAPTRNSALLTALYAAVGHVMVLFFIHK